MTDRKNKPKKPKKNGELKEYQKRFAELMDREGGHLAFARRSGLGSETVRLWYLGSSEPSGEQLSLLVKNRPDIDLNWIFSGQTAKTANPDYASLELKFTTEASGLKTSLINVREDLQRQAESFGGQIGWIKEQITSINVRLTAAAERKDFEELKRLRETG